MRLRTNHRSGQSLVEFALGLPILLLLLLALADFGFLLYAHVQVANAAREGARAGSLYLDERFHYTSCKQDCPTGYGYDVSEPPCWTPTLWVENALAQHVRTANGCPTSAFDTSVHAFGLLSPTQCASATSGTNCWWLTPVGTIVAGNPVTVTVTYRFTIPFFGQLTPFADQIVEISKTTIMKAQTN